MHILPRMRSADEGSTTQRKKSMQTAATTPPVKNPYGLMFLDYTSNYPDFLATTQKSNVKCPPEGYLKRHPELTRRIRCILIDWLDELQDTIGLSHECLYLAVKFVDNYLALCAPNFPKRRLQLLGAIALMSATKCEMRMCPELSSFSTYCADAFSLEEFQVGEVELMSLLNFRTHYTLSYTVLRMLGKVAQMNMQQLTVARFLLECTLACDESVTKDDIVEATCAIFLGRQLQNLKPFWPKELRELTGMPHQVVQAHAVTFAHRLRCFQPKELTWVLRKYDSTVFFQTTRNHIEKIFNTDMILYAQNDVLGKNG